jgi:hypothetical protein
VFSGCPRIPGEHKVHPYAHPEVLCRGESCIRPFRSFYRFFLFSDSLLGSFLSFSSSQLPIFSASQLPSLPPGCQGQELELISLTRFQTAERNKKIRELGHIFNYPDEEVVKRLVEAGRGNPRLMEWLDILVGEMVEAEVPVLLEAVKDKQEEFIRSHVVRELVRCGGAGLARFLGWLAVYRQPVLIDGVREMGERAGLEGWQGLLQRGIGLSLLEYDRAGESYGVTMLLREELLAGEEFLKDCHGAAFA